MADPNNSTPISLPTGTGWAATPGSRGRSTPTSPWRRCRRRWSPSPHRAPTSGCWTSAVARPGWNLRAPSGPAGRVVARTSCIGNSIHGFSESSRQHTNAIRAPGLAALRMWTKAATGSPKNITPKFDTSKSNSSRPAVAASACCQSTLAMPVASARIRNLVQVLTAAGWAPPRLHKLDLDLDIAAGRGLEAAVVQSTQIGAVNSWLRGQPAEAVAIASIREALMAHLDGTSVRLPGAM
jgi:hypothetical protein